MDQLFCLRFTFNRYSGHWQRMIVARMLGAAQQHNYWPFFSFCFAHSIFNIDIQLLARRSDLLVNGMSVVVAALINIVEKVLDTCAQFGMRRRRRCTGRIINFMEVEMLWNGVAFVLPSLVGSIGRKGWRKEEDVSGLVRPFLSFVKR